MHIKSLYFSFSSDRYLNIETYFTMKEAMGHSESSFWLSRKGFIFAKNPFLELPPSISEMCLNSQDVRKDKPMGALFAVVHSLGFRCFSVVFAGCQRKTGFCLVWYPQKFVYPTKNKANPEIPSNLRTRILGLLWIWGKLKWLCLPVPPIWLWVKKNFPRRGPQVLVGLFFLEPNCFIFGEPMVFF